MHAAIYTSFDLRAVSKLSTAPLTFDKC